MTRSPAPLDREDVGHRRGPARAVWDGTGRPVPATRWDPGRQRRAVPLDRRAVGRRSCWPAGPGWTARAWSRLRRRATGASSPACRRRRRSVRSAETSATVVVSVVGPGRPPGTGHAPDGCPGRRRRCDAAGGLLPEADPASVNLAAVGRRRRSRSPSGVPASGRAAPAGSRAAAGAPAAAGRLDLNTADRRGTGCAAGHRTGPRPADRGSPQPRRGRSAASISSTTCRASARPSPRSWPSWSTV